jgi:hypothetical protein
MTKSNLKALNAYFRAKSLTYFFLKSLQMKILIFNRLILIPIALSAKLSISGKHFEYNKQVFLSGANFAWNHYSKLGK